MIDRVIGVLASAGGAVLDQLVRATAGSGVRFVVVTDRPCGAEDWASKHRLPRRRIELADNDQLSVAAHRWLVDEGASAVLLLFSRLVTAQLHGRLPTFNIHPSLLPAFPGFGALTQAREAGVRVVGATLHLAVAQPDAGPIVAQTWAPVPPHPSASALGTLSFVQKTLLGLVLCELLAADALRVDAAHGTVLVRAALAPDDRSNPALTDPGLRRFVDDLHRQVVVAR